MVVIDSILGDVLDHKHPATDIIGEIPVSAMSFKGAYDNAVDYAVGDSVSYNGSSYVMFNNAAAGTLPTNTSYWQIVASKGDQGIQGNDGPTGPAGADGDAGVGVPTGGASGQILAKNSNTNYDTKWIDPPTGGSGIPESLAIAYATAL